MVSGIVASVVLAIESQDGMVWDACNMNGAGFVARDAKVNKD